MLKVLTFEHRDTQICTNYHVEINVQVFGFQVTQYICRSYSNLLVCTFLERICSYQKEHAT